MLIVSVPFTVVAAALFWKARRTLRHVRSPTGTEGGRSAQRQAPPSAVGVKADEPGARAGHARDSVAAAQEAGGETRDDPLFGRLTWRKYREQWSGWWEGTLQAPEGQSVHFSVSSEAIDREDVRRLFSRITADLEAVHQRLADEQLPDLNEFAWPDSPMTREAFLSRIQLCGIDINPDGCIYVEFDDQSEEDILTGHGIGYIFHLDGRIEGTGSG